MKHLIVTWDAHGFTVKLKQDGNSELLWSMGPNRLSGIAIGEPMLPLESLKGMATDVAFRLAREHRIDFRAVQFVGPSEATQNVVRRAQLLAAAPMG